MSHGPGYNMQTMRGRPGPGVPPHVAVVTKLSHGFRARHMTRTGRSHGASPRIGGVATWPQLPYDRSKGGPRPELGAKGP
jgi:hypothetical protein